MGRERSGEEKQNETREREALEVADCDEERMRLIVLFFIIH